MVLLGQISPLRLEREQFLYGAREDWQGPAGLRGSGSRTDAGNCAAASGSVIEVLHRCSIGEGMTSFVPEGAAIGRWRRKAKGQNGAEICSGDGGSLPAPRSHQSSSSRVAAQGAFTF
jgi:hypothetical protein